MQLGGVPLAQLEQSPMSTPAAAEAKPIVDKNAIASELGGVPIPGFARATQEKAPLTPQQQAEAMASRKSGPEFDAKKQLAVFLEAHGKKLEEGVKGMGVMAVTEGVGASLGAIIGKIIPSAARAGQKFDIVAKAANQIPLDTTAAGKAITRASELRERGSTLPKVMRDFVKASETGKPPITYEIGRDFASNAGALSKREATALNAKMHRQVAEFAHAMKTANREAAAKAGMEKLYDAAMKEYRQASNIKEAGEIIKKWGVRALFAAGLGSAGAAGYELWKSH